MKFIINGMTAGILLALWIIFMVMGSDRTGRWIGSVLAVGIITLVCIRAWQQLPSKKLSYIVYHLGGNCPVQAEGRVDGYPFYFRARGEQWSMSIADNKDMDFEDLWSGSPDAWHYIEGYGDGPYDAGWMEEFEARAFIEKAVRLYEEHQATKEHNES